MCPISQDMLQHAIENPDELLSCMHFHKGIDCNAKMIYQFIAGSKSLSKMYLIVHLVPFLLFKRKKVKQKYIFTYKKSKKGNFKVNCSICKIHSIRRWVFSIGTSINMFLHNCTYQSRTYNIEVILIVSCTFGAIVSAFTLNFEPVSRQSYIALFCLNKTLYTSYNMMIRRNYPVKVPHGEVLLMAISLGIIAYHYFNNKKAIRESYLNMLDKLLSNS